MLNDFILTDKQLKTPLYQQIYQSVREAIESGSLKKGSKLPFFCFQYPHRLSESHRTGTDDGISGKKNSEYFFFQIFRNLLRQFHVTEDMPVL